MGIYEDQPNESSKGYLSELIVQGSQLPSHEFWKAQRMAEDWESFTIEKREAYRCALAVGVGSCRCASRKGAYATWLFRGCILCLFVVGQKLETGTKLRDFLVINQVLSIWGRLLRSYCLSSLFVTGHSNLSSCFAYYRYGVGFLARMLRALGESIVFICGLAIDHLHIQFLSTVLNNWKAIRKHSIILICLWDNEGKMSQWRLWRFLRA